MVAPPDVRGCMVAPAAQWRRGLSAPTGRRDGGGRSPAVRHGGAAAPLGGPSSRRGACLQPRRRGAARPPRRCLWDGRRTWLGLRCVDAWVRGVHASALLLCACRRPRRLACLRGCNLQQPSSPLRCNPRLQPWPFQSASPNFVFGWYGARLVTAKGRRCVSSFPTLQLALGAGMAQRHGPPPAPCTVHSVCTCIHPRAPVGFGAPARRGTASLAAAAFLNRGCWVCPPPGVGDGAPRVSAPPLPAPWGLYPHPAAAPPPVLCRATGARLNLASPLCCCSPLRAARPGAAAVRLRRSGAVAAISLVQAHGGTPLAQIQLHLQIKPPEQQARGEGACRRAPPAPAGGRRLVRSRTPA